MFGFHDTQRQMQNLLLETRNYVGLQKKALLAETRDKLSLILSQLAIAVVCLVLGSMVLVFFLFFLAYIIGQALGNNAIGFALVAAFVLLLLLCVWFMRKIWIVGPITNMMSRIFMVDNKPLSTEEVTEELKDSRTRMTENYHQLIGGSNRATSKVESISNLIGRGFAIYEGVRIGTSIFRALNMFFNRRRK
ncbi:MAG: hypothetical protein IK084_01435 [Bacteroidaceae bacterium]|nr:hypothetical protein [Bacteroidaceae bacterium]